MEIANNPIFKDLERVLDVSSQRASLVASNVANVDTPGYKARTFDFDAALASCGERPAGMRPVRTDPRHIGQPVQGKTAGFAAQETDDAASERYDGNTVDIEREMADLLEAELMFAASSRLIAHKIAMLKMSIS